MFLLQYCDIQDDYMEALGKLHMTVTRAYKVGLVNVHILCNMVS